MRKIIKLAENDLEVATEGGTFVSVMGDTFETVAISFEIHFSTN